MYDLLFIAGLLLLGYIFGQMAEKRHFKSIIKREAQYANLLTFCKRFPLTDNADQQAIARIFPDHFMHPSTTSRDASSSCRQRFVFRATSIIVEMSAARRFARDQNVTSMRSCR